MRSYVTGFVFSLLLTLGAFGLVLADQSRLIDLSFTWLVASIIILASLQLIVQLLFFLHLGREAKPRFNLVAFLFMLMVIVLLVGGSLWIMMNLNYHMMHQSNIEEYILHDEGVR